MSIGFNESFNEEGEKARFIYKRNPLLEHAFQIFEFKAEKKTYEPVGDYTLLDLDEALDLTEKKVVAVVRAMNDKENIPDFSHLTDTRLLFQLVPDNPESLNHKLIFRTYDGTGVSKDNAILTVEKGVLDESISEDWRKSSSSV